MNLPDSLRCMFSARVDRQDGSFVVEIPEEEVDLGTVNKGQVYKAALLSTPDSAKAGKTAVADSPTQTRDNQERREQEPPVEEGEIREVEIEDLGDQGDGLARIGPGYVVFVPGTRVGDQVRIEITDARENVAFADLLESA